MKNVLFGFALSLFCVSMSAQTALNGVINAYTSILEFEPCDSSSIRVSSAASFSPGDKVLIIQMKGAEIDLSNSPNFGNITALRSAGNYEFNRIRTISGNLIKLDYKIERSYEVTGKVQLVKVPEYTSNLVVNGLTCKPWDGWTGGVLAFYTTGSVILQGTGIEVSGMGFRGGAYINAPNSRYYIQGYFFPPDPNLAGQKGEGISEVPVSHSFGCGKSANGGGGGNAHNAGGGGGGNGGSGGNGGFDFWETPNGSPTPNTNGLGGLAIFENAPYRITMGGGGGAGNSNDNKGSGGGNGGGIVFIKARSIEGNGKISANGVDITGPGGDNVNDGQGGGGAGGTIVIEAEQIASSVIIEAKGGRGGDCLFFKKNQIIGPGGGGGGGKIVLSKDFPGLSVNLSGGINGITNQNQNNGARPGIIGTKITGFSIWEDNTKSPTRSPIERTIFLCPDSSIIINGIRYNQETTVKDTLKGKNKECDTFRITHIKYYEKVEPFLPHDTTICKGENIVLSSPYPNTMWNAIYKGKTLNVSEPGLYVADATDQNGCRILDSIFITGCCKQGKFYIPNVFAPETYGLNREFCVYPSEYCTDYILRIYDRWGSLVFESNSLGQCWDGTYRGKPMPPGVYVWVIEVRPPKSNTIERYKGDVTLIR